MEKVKKSWYLKKNQVNLSSEEYQKKMLEYAWTVREIQIMLKLSYRKARALFNKVKKEKGCLEFDAHQVKREDVLSVCGLTHPVVLKEE